MVMGEISEQVEVVVVGGGPGGYAAAFHAADLGKKVALVEQESRLGGVCLLRGCIPSKAMISAGELLGRVRQAEQMGIMVKDVSVDMKRLGAWRDGVVNELAGGIEALCKPRGIRRIVGRAYLKGRNELQITGKDESFVLRFQHAVLAVGSRPVMPPPFQKSDNVITSDEALSLDTVPESLLVVGGGYIGIELGSCLAALGSKVTIVELLDRLLAGTDTDLVRVVRKHLEQHGVAIHLDSKVGEIVPHDGKVRVKVQPKAGDSWEAEFAKVLVAIGRKPNTEDLGLERAGVELDDKGHIRVDAQCRTAVPHIFAIGDCTGQPYLAHRARRQGIVAAESIAGHPAAFDNRTIPAVVFSDPEIAYCGLSEEEAKQAGYDVKVGRFRFAASGRAKTLNQTEGLVIVVAEAGTEVILGVRMVGPNVSELIGEATLAVETGAVLEDLITTIHVHPTLSETLQEAAEAIRGHAIHTYRPAREERPRGVKATSSER
jgi:dihydrolipoamide dehydrogenase